jgi:hypothetical protein
MKTAHNPASHTSLNMPAALPKPDASGTDPNRYATPANTEKDPEDYNQKPDNHTQSHERMLNPERGEK